MRTCKKYKKKKAGGPLNRSRKTITIGVPSNRSRKTIKKKEQSIQSTRVQDQELLNFLNELYKFPEFKKLDHDNDNNKIKDNVKEFFINNRWEIPHARKIMGDFITLLRNEGFDPTKKKEFNPISTSIQDDCFNNFQDGDKKCFCCGEDINYVTSADGKLVPKDVACDHVIPIITMLLTVKTDSISKNLHYIHKTCNGAKKDLNIYETYQNLGKRDGIFKCDTDNTRYCRTKFLNILEKLNLRTVDQINYRKLNIKPFKDFINGFKEYIQYFLNDEVSAALALQSLSKAKARTLNPSQS